MPIKWKLRECLEERGITSASQVSKLVRHRTGYVLSRKQSAIFLMSNLK